MKESEYELKWWCESCRKVARELEIGMCHCSDPVNCGGMIQIKVPKNINVLVVSGKESNPEKMKST
jgi:hypothetical protein